MTKKTLVILVGAILLAGAGWAQAAKKRKPVQSAPTVEAAQETEDVETSTATESQPQESAASAQEAEQEGVSIVPASEEETTGEEEETVPAQVSAGFIPSSYGQLKGVSAVGGQTALFFEDEAGVIRVIYFKISGGKTILEKAAEIKRR